MDVRGCSTPAGLVPDEDERLNWPSVTLHIPTSELGVMGEK